jgi:hypothetical protein
MTTPLFVQEAARVVRPRLSEVLFDRMERKFGSLAELPSNVEAIDAGLLFATGLNPFVALVGPSGWGKTHLLECVTNHLAKEFGVRSKIVSAFDWLHGRHIADPHTPLLIDDVQDAMSRTRSRVQMRLALERRVRIGRPTMLAITGDRLTRQHLSFLPVVREWSIHELAAPAPSERRIVVEQMAKLEGLYLSRFLSRLLALRMKGNGNTIHGALNRLKLSGVHWTTSEEVLSACGILDPFFADNSAWDLKEKICSAANRTCNQFPRLDASELSCYAMLHVAHLSEIDAARACGVEPAKARSKAIKFQKSLGESEISRSGFVHFLETTVESLAEG